MRPHPFSSMLAVIARLFPGKDQDIFLVAEVLEKAIAKKPHSQPLRYLPLRSARVSDQITTGHRAQGRVSLALGKGFLSHCEHLSHRLQNHLRR